MALYPWGSWTPSIESSQQYSIAQNTVLLDIWWKMLIKFSKQIGNSQVKMTERWIQDHAKHLRWSFFCKSLLGEEACSKSCQTSKIELFVKIVKSKKLLTIFVKTSILDVWQGSEYASEKPSKVTDVSFSNQFEYQR